MSDEDIERYIWEPHNVWAGEELYGICIGLRGFYMKVTVHLGSLPRITASLIMHVSCALSACMVGGHSNLRSDMQSGLHRF